MAKRMIKTRSDYRAAWNNINSRFDRLRKVLKQVPAQTIHECLQDTLEKSVQRAPVDEGALREAGHVAVNGTRTIRGNVDGSTSRLQTYTPEPTADLVEFQIGYTVEGGGKGREGNVNLYAMVQHEHTEFDHPKGGEAKFLESAIAEDRATWNKRIKEATAAALKKEGD